MRIRSITAAYWPSCYMWWVLCLLVGTLGSFCSCPCWAQNTSSTSQKDLLPPWYLPKSPTANLLERFDNQQLVNLPTGGAQLSIPLGNIQCGTLQLPLSLAYAYTGLKVAQPYDYVGLGWTLQAQSIITRQVNGLPDELFYNDPVHRYHPDTIELVSRRDFLERLLRNDYDSGPDLYSYALPNGTSGRFLLRDTTITLFPQQPVHIRCLGSNGFQIATEDGVRYQFQAAERTSPDRRNFFGRTAPYNSAWHLTRLVSADNADTLHLHYSAYGSERIPLQCTLTTGEYYTGSFRDIGNVQERPIPCGSAADYPFHNVALLNNFITGQYLDSITTRGARLLLLRTDKIQTAQRRHEFKGIRLLATPSTGGRREIKRVQLYQSHFDGDTLRDYRLRLDSLQESANGLARPPYRFHYHNEVWLPSRASAAQDYWGYANGVTQNGDVTTTVTPTLLADPHFTFGGQRPADREPNFSFALAGALEKVQYPTGGTAQWEYEQGRMYIDPLDAIVKRDSTGVEVGPLSYNAAHVDLINGTSVTPSDTVRFNVPEEGTVVVTLSRQPSNEQNAGGGNNIYRDFNIWHQLPTGDTLITNSTGIGAYKAYNPTTGKRFRFYLQPGTYYAKVYCERKELSSSLFIRIPYTDSSKVDIGPGIRVVRTISTAAGAPALVRNYTYKANGKQSGYSLLPAYGKGFNHYEFTREYYTTGHALYYDTQCQIVKTSSSNRGIGNDFNKYDFYYGCVTEATASTQGQTAHYFTALTQQFNDVVPASRATYRLTNGQLQLVQRIEYSYTSDSLLTRYPLVQVLDALQYVDTGSFHPPSEYTTQPYEVATCFVSPTRTAQTSYDTQGNAYLTETRSYYERQRLVRTASSGSTGWTIQRFKRLNQYAPTSVVKALQAYSFNPIVETQTWFRPLGRPDSMLTGGQVTLYSPQWRAPISSYQLQLPQPQPGPNQETLLNSKFTTFLSDSRYERQVTVRYATPTGDVAQQQVAHGRPVSYLTGYDHTLVIAEAQNATYAQVAYTSFEPASTGRWQYDSTGTHRVTGASRTGQWAYRLDGGGEVKRSQLPAGDYELTYWAQGPVGPSLVLGGGSQLGTGAMRLTTAPGNWHQYRVQLRFTALGTVTLQMPGGSPVLVDEVRLNPAGARLTSYTHLPLVGMTSQTGPDGRTLTYEYDGLGQLVRTRDEQGRILGQQHYHYAGH